MRDPRVERVVGLLCEASLASFAATALESAVAPVLFRSLAGLPTIQRRAGTGIDGSTRRPDDARTVAPMTGAGSSLELAIELKLYRNRKQAAGEMDRALGQSVAYAEKYDAVLFFVVYMSPPEHAVPKHWLDLASPLRVGHSDKVVPIYFASRPLDWDAEWSRSFSRPSAPANQSLQADDHLGRSVPSVARR